MKPHFHALFLPETFLHNRLSYSAVTTGQVDEERTLVFDYDADNLNEAVDGNGIGAGTILDAGIGNSPWKFDCKEAAFAAELVHAEAKMLGEGIECTKLTSIPTKINPRDKSCDLLTRPESRGVVSDVFHRFAREPRRGSVAAITGSAGIGKSWTLFYALQQALLYDGATVLFYFQKQDKAVMYLRRNNKMYAWTSTSIKQRAHSILFERSDVLVLLDPRDIEQGGAEFCLGELKLLYAASNNKDHFKGAASKNDGEMEAYIGPPPDVELRVILAHLDPQLRPDVIEERKKNVGNLLWYLLDGTGYIDRLKTTNESLIACIRDSELLKKAVRADGMSDGRLTIPGTLFQILPTRPAKLAEIGYEGQNIEYRKPVVLPANQDVWKAVSKLKKI